jgi:enamine deaminase RidA (YjgF/YER057c/UK114 family)
MKRINLATTTPWEPVVGYSRAVRVGDAIHVTGTTATLPHGGHIGDDNAYAQARQALHNIEAALRRLGGSLGDIVRTRIYVTRIERDWQAVGKAHAELLGHVRPATTMVEVSALIEDWMLVEIEADAVIGATATESRTL